jgi:hypothetical protein
MCIIAVFEGFGQANSLRNMSMPRLPPEQSEQRAKQPDVLDHYDDNHARHDCH